jgi:amino acid adenylation domain-containing protein/thioester reductase-like protein
MHNLTMIRLGFQMERVEGGIGVFWLPSYHDMGLVGGILEPMYVGGSSTLMPPAAFLQRPARWLEAITRYGGTVTGAPNFAYDLCVDKITPEQREGLDLSTLRVAFCGAEPIRQDTLERFAETFEPHGFRKEAFYPCYGLAEGTLIVSGGQGPAAPTIFHVKRSSLERNQVVETSPDEKNAQALVSSGGTLFGQEIVIVDPDTLTRCPAGRVGEIWVSGPNVATGYWNQPEETQLALQARISDTGEGPFLRTGDLGFMHDEHLFVTGRLKDLIIIRGRNHIPQDIELTVGKCHPALQTDSGAAFTVATDDGEERLVIVQEVTRRHRNSDMDDVVLAVRRAVAETHELQVYALVLIKPLKIPRTSSGKIKRHACKAGFLNGGLPVVAEWRADFAMADADGVETIDETRPTPTEMVTSESSQSAATIEAWLVSQIARRAGISAAQIEIRRPFVDFGLDSVQAVSLTGDLEVWLNQSLSPTLVWDYPNIESLAAYLAGEVPITVSQPRAEVSERQSFETEPVAIVGLSCRLPGADSPEAFWELLRNGVDAISEVPAERWDVDGFYDADPATQGKMNTRWGGFLEGVDQFDPTFFGISPREATRMDPQQRLLLEVAWEALERAGQAPGKLAGSLTGVFIGISTTDYSWLQYSDPNRIDAYAGTGNAHSIAANRLSYLLDLRGPSVALDTACSSSLVAIHLACQSLQTGESNLALAGGVNLLLSPELTVTFSQARMMASDGRCKTFDARADGYVRGEGCGVVVLKRLSDALRDGDNILAVVRGSAVNHDGRSNGLTAPNGLSQQAVIRQALQNAGVAPAQLNYIEAHGTGTSLGDPIEIHSLRAVVEEDRSPDQSYLVGSVKTNIGHLESAAGVAGLMKVVLSLMHEEIPPHLHLEEVNPHISLDGSPLVITTESQAWPRGEMPRLAGVSSFGFGGTNAHIVLGEAPVTDGVAELTQDQVERPAHVLALSAKSEFAVQMLARSYADFLADTTDTLADTCFTANTGRSHFDHRLAVVADSTESLRERLDAFAAGERPAGLLSGRVQNQDKHKIAFLFTGQGAQYPGMGRQLYETEPVFRAALDRCDEILRSHLEHSLLSVLYPEQEDDPLLNQTAHTQPALFALEYALSELWRSWGVEPDVVMGHSVGEYVAACVAGVFSLEDGLALIAERGRLMQTLPLDGMMAAVFAGEAQVAPILEPFLDRASIAAANGPENTVISGEQEAVTAILERLEGIVARPLTVSHAFHSPLMEPMLDAFEEAAGRQRFEAPRIPLVSNLTGQILEPDEIPDAAYWRRHVREAVRFADGMAAIAGYEIFLEMGPQPTLLGMGRRCLPQSDAAWLPSLRNGQEDWQVILDSLGALYVEGIDIDWDGFGREYARRRVSLPTYPFERQRYWFDLAENGRRRRPTRVLDDAHHLGGLNGRFQTELEDFESRLAELPETATLEAILDAAADVFGDAAQSNGQESHTSPKEGELTRQALLAQEPEARPPLVETYLQAQAARVLGLDPSRLDVHQPFDTLGLDSLMAIELKNSVESGLGVALPIVTLLQGPTLAQLTGQVLDLLAEPMASSVDSVALVPVTGNEHPLSYGQQALWFLHQLTPEDFSFNVAGAVRVLDDIDASALRQAFQELVNRHASLRTTFSVSDGQPVQRIQEYMAAPFHEEDASTWNEDALHEYLMRKAHRSFNLENGPVLRVILLRRSHKEHVLLLAMDHIITDFWSMSVLAHELFVLYSAAASSTPAPLPSLEFQYTDYVHWQDDVLAGPEGERLWAYWKEQLAGELPILNLPTDRPRTPFQTYVGDTESMTLSPELAEQLKTLARSHGATLYTVLLAAFQALLYRYTGQEDLVVGSVMAGRSHPELADLVGYFINPVALRADFSGDPTFADFLGQVRGTVFEALEHQDYPPALLAQRLQLVRDPSRPPIFETMFILQKAQVPGEQELSAFALGMSGARMEWGEITLESMALGGQPAQFDLTLMMAEMAGGLAASRQYNTALFDPSTIQQMLAHLGTLLEGITAHPDQSISAFPLLTEEERHQLLVEWNETEMDYPRDKSIHHLFEAQAGRTPDEVAVICDGEQLTYGELNRRANQLGHYLQGLGIGPDVLVGIYVERSVEMMVGLLGVLKAGGAYVPLDPAFPPDRLALMIEDSQAPVILTQERLAQTLPEHHADVISLDADWERIAAMNDETPSSDVTPDDMAYVIYTSGSTGKPKGVQVLHRGVVNFLTSMQHEPGLTDQDGLLAVTTLSFDIAVLELFLPLIVGARVEIATQETASDGMLLMEKLVESEATIIQATPATYRMLIEAGWQGDSQLRVLCGGEAMPQDLAGQLLTRCASLWNMYGPTETTIWSTVYPVDAHGGPISIGRPIGNTQLYLLDSQMEPVPVGVVGELYIGGDGVARGYLNRPELNAEKFIPDPFGSEPGARLYATGDVARYLPDGNVEFLGRNDHQVKIRGFRIELGDIEAPLAQHPAIRHPVVVVREDSPGDKRLVGYLVMDDGQPEIPVGELRAFLRDRLPDYMLPSVFVTLDAMPLTPNEKVDRRALPAPPQTRPDLEATYVAPRNPLEEELAQLCAGVLSLERVGIHDNFFDLGGNSLLATRLIFQVRERFEVQVLLRSLFEEPTVAGLARAIEVGQQGGLFTSITLEELNAEVALDPVITGDGMQFEPVGDPDHIFLTGATGFVGAFLLHTLLRQTRADIHCLVRAASVEEGKQRLQRNLETYLLWDDSLRDRIIVVPGDLAQPTLGLGAETFEALAGQMDMVYHNGAMVNFVYPYQAHKAANVLGTQEVLRLASASRLKPVHFVSTLSVFHTGDHDDGTVFHEGDDLDQVGVPFGGYAQSKWVAEKLVMEAGSRGMPVAIYRPGLVSGASATGAWNTDDMMSTLAKICLSVGVAPDLDVMVDVVPVDYVSDAIVHLSQQPAPLGQVFHLSNPQPLHYRELLEAVRSLGFPVRSVPFDQWRGELFSHAAASGADGWNPFLPLIEEVGVEQVFMPPFDCQNTLSGLAGSSINCPPVGLELFSTYFSYFAGIGFLDGHQPS